MPLHFKVTFADDTTESYEVPVQVWFTSNRVTRTVAPGKEIKEVQVDPQRAFPDHNRKNNTWKVGAESRPQVQR